MSGRLRDIPARSAEQERAAAGHLLADGITRFMPGTSCANAPEGYARITHPLPRRSIPGAIPAALAGLVVPPVDADRDRLNSLVFMDIESLGFVGRPLFLVGALFARRPDQGTRWNLELVQYLARDYSEEEAILRSFWRDAAEGHLWISFNGRTFDLPFLALRATHYRLPPLTPQRHLDLLPVARRLWGGEVPDCRLKTLERAICGRPRPGGDIPGSRIPAAYHDYVRTGEPFELLDILRHNAADLSGLLALYLHALDALLRKGEGSFGR